MCKIEDFKFLETTAEGFLVPQNVDHESDRHAERQTRQSVAQCRQDRSNRARTRRESIAGAEQAQAQRRGRKIPIITVFNAVLTSRPIRTGQIFGAAGRALPRAKRYRIAAVVTGNQFHWIDLTLLLN